MKNESILKQCRTNQRRAATTDTFRNAFNMNVKESRKDASAPSTPDSAIKASTKSLKSIRNVALTLLAGVADDGCVLSYLRGTPHILKFIFVLATNEDRWRRCILISDIYKQEEKANAADSYDSYDSDEFQESPPNEKDEEEERDGDAEEEEEEKEDHWQDSDDSVDPDDRISLAKIPNNQIYFTKVLLKGDWYSDISERLEFPEPLDINVNMMPFILGSCWEECGLPDYLRGYWPLIDRCASPETFKEERPEFFFRPRVKTEIGKICFLTVQESFVEAGSTQRRPGLHVDNAGSVKLADAETGKSRRRKRKRKEGKEGEGESWGYNAHHWGHGGCQFIPRPKTQAEIDEAQGSGSDDDDDDEERFRVNYQVMYGGIYMASTVDSSCKAWNCKIVKDRKSGREVIGNHGNIQHLRHLLSDDHATTTRANRLYWMTDRTPHESLPLKRGMYRQFFRLVTSRVGLWFADHSTPNPNGIKPDPSITKTVRGNKFNHNGAFVVVPKVEEEEDEEKIEKE